MRLVVVVVFVAAVLSWPVRAAAPAPQSPPADMCGNGTTFTVNLPGRQGSLPDGAFVPDDSVTLPDGCRIYALFVSGYSVNPMLNLLTFYKLAQFVAANNGYVHYAWWNNLMGEYLSGPLHGTATHEPTPGGATKGLGFVPLADDAPKAIPEEDHQFQDDARRMLAAIRQRNPHAVIVVAGHSMGGNAVVRLGASTSTVIDVLAPIDPVGNRSNPVGRPPTLPLGHTYNWTRWRVANSLAGFRQVDCVRNAFNLCRDFDPHPLRFEARCALGPILNEPPLSGTRSVFCPQAQPIVVVNPRPNIGENVRYLYHRWQNEFPFPFDFPQHYPLSRGGRPFTGLLGGNYQEPIDRNLPNESNPAKSCGLFGSFSSAALALLALNPVFAPPVLDVAQPQDPNDPNIECSPYDGHGEVVGLRGALVPYGVGATGGGWPCHAGAKRPGPGDDCAADNVDLRKQAFLSLVTSTPPLPGKTIADPPAVKGWAYEPANPHLDLVVNDLLTIVQELLNEAPSPDTTAPVTVATTMPEPNAAGWHNEDVLVRLSASDAGSGVQELVYALAGAQSQPPVTTSDASVDTNIVNEGSTIVSFTARDNTGNVETQRSLPLKLDKTPPSISASTDRLPNAHGWFNAPVTVSFLSSDLLSGVVLSSPPVTIAGDGAGQEVVGLAIDAADNQSAGSVSLNIDRAAPAVTISSPTSGATLLLNAVLPADYACRDALSGIASCTGTVANGAAIDTSSPGPKSFVVTAADRADNTASSSHVYAVHYGFSGFGAPLGGAPFDAHVAQAGQALPVKYSLRDAHGASIADLRSVVELSSSAVGCTATSPGALSEPAVGAGGGLRYDAAAGQFVFVWRTSRDWADTCRMLRLVLADGTEYIRLIRFR